MWLIIVDVLPARNKLDTCVAIPNLSCVICNGIVQTFLYLFKECNGLGDWFLSVIGEERLIIDPATIC